MDQLARALVLQGFIFALLRGLTFLASCGISHVVFEFRQFVDLDQLWLETSEVMNVKWPVISVHSSCSDLMQLTGH